MVENAVLDPSRLQFALTALYHFLFVPLTLGLTVIIAIMETIYVKTGKEIYKDMARFWGKLFGINFAVGVATGLTMEFQFGTNWSYYSHFVGDIFGAPLAIEALVAFFLESTLVGLMFFGWDRMGRKTHLVITWLTALGTNLSALWILVANGWMQYPVGSVLNPQTVRHEVMNFADVVLSPVAQAKFLHTVSGGYVFGAMFVLGISAWYLLKGRDLEFARKSFTVAAIFGFFASLSVVLFGHESGIHVNEHQPGKMAAIEAHYDGVDGCIDFKLFAWPSYKSSIDFTENDSWVSIPCGTSLINYYKPKIVQANGERILGAKQVVEQNIPRVKNGIVADEALQIISGKKVLQNSEDQARALEAAKVDFDKYKQDWGYGQLVKAVIPVDRSIASATEEEIRQAAELTIPKDIPSLFWAFRIMVDLGVWFILLFAWASFSVIKRSVGRSILLSRLALWSIPLPLVAIECGWFVAEHGRQPWAIDGVLPTFLAVSGITVAEVWFTLIAIITLYTGFLIVELYLMFKYARLGPSALKTGRYSLENSRSIREV
ncbi:cytochrome bd-I ubiquinol oxidase subunit CydA [Neisseriaceae bacterium PsAf]|nr:cytochrome bd-I ubiquinol oxidase subunit CydA [Neisseriaceae bacterium PsAf]MCV2503535.1 cytochrome ubiquinol oxidase subunit I [Neisseriaceae bacterium]